MASEQPGTSAARSTSASRLNRLRLGYSTERLGNVNASKTDEEKEQASKRPVGFHTDFRNSSSNKEPAEYENLDELAGPPPVDPAEEERRGTKFENRTLEPTTETAINGNWTPIQCARVSRFATEIYTISYLIFFSIFGTLARLGLQALTFYPGAPVQTGVLWANVGGSLIMGFLAQDRALFKQNWGDQASKEGASEEKRRRKRTPSEDKRHGSLKKTIPLYIGLATGFCGSFTSFSSFMRDVFYALANALPVPINHLSTAPISQTLNVHRNPGYSFMAVCAVLTTTVGLSLGALNMGAHLALALKRFMPSLPFHLTRKVLDPLMIAVAWGCWLGAVLLAVFPPDRPGGPSGKATWAQETWRSKALFAIVFAPIGCLLRFYVSLFLNPRIRSFYLGTFAVNVFGTAMEAMFIDLQRSRLGGMVGCQVLQGLMDGFCGCLTTVSTWVVELNGLKLRHAYLYGTASMATGLSLFVIITGSLLWTQGFVPMLCTT